MNVRSLSPEGGGVLLPFRGNREDEPERPDGSDPAREAGSPTVVHLTRRRRRSEPDGEPGTRPAPPRNTGPRGRPSWRRAGLFACAALLVGAATAAALTGVLPLTTERPQPRTAVSAPPTSAGAENGNLPAAYGLCTAFDRAAERGDDVATTQAFRNLAHAAGGSSRVSAYCAPFDDLDRGRAR